MDLCIYCGVDIGICECVCVCYVVCVHECVWCVWYVCCVVCVHECVWCVVCVVCVCEVLPPIQWMISGSGQFEGHRLHGWNCGMDFHEAGTQPPL